MNLRRYFLMFIICISSFMIYTNNVKAENSYAQITLHNISYGTFNGNYSNVGNYNALNYVNFTPNNSNSYLNFNFDSRIIPQYSNYFLFPFSMYVDNDKSLTCNNEYVAGNILQDINFSTTYSDGSKAQNSGTIESSSSIYRYCQSYSYYENTTGIIVSYMSNNNATEFYCNVFSGGNDYVALCPITQSQSNGSTDFSRLRIHFSDNSSNNITFHIKYGGQVNFNIDNTYTILNKLTSIENKLNELKSNSSTIANNTTQIKNDIKDSSIDNDSTSSSASGWSSKNASNNTITQLLTLPISLLTNITNSINSSCSSFSLGTLFDTELVLPCINLQDYLGSSLVSIIDILFSGFMIYNIAKKLIKIFNDFTNLKSNQIDEIYGGGNE